MSVSDTSKIKVIGVAGGSASGKTTIVNIIREQDRKSTRLNSSHPSSSRMPSSA